MVATFQGNPETTIISCYSPTNVSEEEQVENCNYDLSSLTRQILKHNLLVIGGDFNAHLGNGFLFSYHNETNRNGIMLEDFIVENNLFSLNTHSQKTLTSMDT